MITLIFDKNHFSYKIKKDGKVDGGTVCEKEFGSKLKDNWHKNMDWDGFIEACLIEEEKLWQNHLEQGL
jgi:hypothetical protein